MSVLDRETAEQPEVVARLLDRVLPDLDELAGAAWPEDVTHVVLVARGSSDNAARYAQYLFGIQHRLPVGLATPSLGSIYGVEPDFTGALVVAVSQSGQSPDVVGVLDAARRQGRPAVAVTNDPDSPLARAATYVVDLAAGPEDSVAATKTYTASLVALALLGLARADAATRQPLVADLRTVPDVLAANVQVEIEAAAQAVASRGHLLVAGRGLNYGTAFEAALKVRELANLVAEPWSPPDLLHGPIAAVSSDATALLIAPSEPSLEGHRALVRPLRERGAAIVALTADRELLAASDHPVALAAEPADWCTPITTILPAQRLAAAVSRARGLDPDSPSGLTKVTRTT